MRHLGQLLGAAQNASHKTQAQIFNSSGIGTGPLGQKAFEHGSKPMPVQETGKRAQASMGRNPLLGETDLDCFLAVMDLNKVGHCLGNRYVGVLCLFFH